MIHRSFHPRVRPKTPVPRRQSPCFRRRDGGATEALGCTPGAIPFSLLIATLTCAVPAAAKAEEPTSAGVAGDVRLPTGEIAEPVRIDAAAKTLPKGLTVARERGFRKRSESGHRHDGAVHKPPIQAESPDSPLSLMWPLCAVLAVIALCVYALRKWMPQAARLTGGGAVHVLARYYLSNKQSLCLVRFGRRVALLGVTPSEITTLSEIADPEEVSSLVVAVERGRPDSFTTMFGTWMSSKEAHDPMDDPDPVGGREERSLSSSRLSQTGRRVRELVDRVRAASSGLRTSAEPT